ncbi:hypothetical protein [uncultured Lacinutrix sp.]|uniref:hypothetical protein n=1 Tax=uncultured Lacinutrix sp. TaxID=574032 RepID=UPI002612A8BD|nr:hypothetical protein [uncultured Lacinutrix sp.]
MTQNILKLLLSLTLIFTIFSCEKDDQAVIDESQLEKKTPLVLNKKIPFEHALHFNTIQEKVSDLQTKITNLQSLNRTSEDDITILTDEVLYVTYASTHTYTFKILRETPQAYIENITLHYDIDTDNYKEYLVQYHVPADQYEALYNGSMLENSNNVAITLLDTGFFETNTQARDCERVCQTIFVDCSSGAHHAGNVGSWGGCTASEAPSTYQSCGSVCDAITAPDGPSGGGGNDGGTGGDVVIISNPLPNEPCANSSTGDTGVKDNNGGCVTLEEDDCPPVSSDVLSQLEEAFGEDNVSTLCDDELLENAPVTNSIEDINALFDEIMQRQFQSTSQGEVDQNNVRADTQSIRLSDPPVEANIVTTVRLNEPINPDDECVNIISVTSEASGNTALTKWEQLDSIDPNDPLNGVLVTNKDLLDEIWIEVRGKLTVGSHYGDLGKLAIITRIVTVKLYYNYTTGEFMNGRILSSF